MAVPKRSSGRQLVRRGPVPQAADPQVNPDTALAQQMQAAVDAGDMHQYLSLCAQRNPQDPEQPVCFVQLSVLAAAAFSSGDFQKVRGFIQGLSRLNKFRTEKLHNKHGLYGTSAGTLQVGCERYFMEVVRGNDLQTVKEFLTFPGMMSTAVMNEAYHLAEDGSEVKAELRKHYMPITLLTNFIAPAFAIMANTMMVAALEFMALRGHPQLFYYMLGHAALPAVASTLLAGLLAAERIGMRAMLPNCFGVRNNHRSEVRFSMDLVLTVLLGGTMVGGLCAVGGKAIAARAFMHTLMAVISLPHFLLDITQPNTIGFQDSVSKTASWLYRGAQNYCPFLFGQASEQAPAAEQAHYADAHQHLA